MCLKIYHLDPVKFISAPGLAWQAALKKTGVKLEFLNDIDMLLMVEKEIRGGICQVIHHYAKRNNKYLKDYDKNKESKIIFSKILLNLEDIIKNYNEESDKGYFVEVDV